MLSGRIIVDQLRNGLRVECETFDSVTIMFCDIHGFSPFVSEKSPLEVTSLLNKIYSIFDPVVDLFDAYKVETIGSIYMVRNLKAFWSSSKDLTTEKTQH